MPHKNIIHARSCTSFIQSVIAREKAFSNSQIAVMTGDKILFISVVASIRASLRGTKQSLKEPFIQLFTDCFVPRNDALMEILPIPKASE